MHICCVGRSFILSGGKVFGFLSSISNIESAATFALFGAKELVRKKYLFFLELVLFFYF